MTDYNVITQTEEQKEAGAFVHAQGMATVDGFGRVSQRWFNQTIDYDAALARMMSQQKERHDIVTDLRGVTFSPTDNGVKVCIEGNCFDGTRWAMSQLCGANALDVGTTCLNQLATDVGDFETLVHVMNNGKRKIQGELLRRFRTYTDGTLRAVVSDSYSPVENSWMIDTIRSVVPNGRVSHFDKSDADNLVLNVLIPDAMFPHNGSDYGGGASLQNSEIGRYCVESCPFAFSTICMNGNVWGREDGIAYRQRHRGIMNLTELRKELSDCITKQLALVAVHNQTLIESREWKVTTGINRLFASIVKEHTLGKSMFAEFKSDWTNFSQEENAFGVVDAITRTAQRFGQDEMVALNSIGGELIHAGRTNWDRMNAKAGSMTDKEFAKFAS